MTIDEMLDRVAENLGVEAPEVKQAAPVKDPPLSRLSCAEKPDNASSHHEHKCKCGGNHSSEHKCGGNCKNHGPEHKCSGNCGSHGSEHKCSCNDVKLDITYAKTLANGLEAAAEAMGVKIVIAIANEGGNLMCLHAMDDSYIASIKASQEKAFTAVALKMPTHVALKESRGGALDGYTNGNGILMLGGGFPLEKGGRIYGGIGVSGGTKEQDILLAQIGAEVFRRL